MQKNKFIWIFSLATILFFATSCDKGVDETIKQSTYFSNMIIKGIDFHGPFDITVIQDSVKNYMILEYPAFLEDRLDIVLNNLGVACVSLENTASLSQSVRVTIYANSLETIGLSGEAKVFSSGIFYGYQTEIDVDEASSFSNLQIYTNICTINVSNSSKVSGKINVISDCKIHVSDASSFVNEFSFIDDAKVVAERASTVNLLSTIVRLMNIDLSESSVAHVFVTEELTYKLTGDSKLYYKGSPSLHEIELSGNSLICRLP